MTEIKEDLSMLEVREWKEKCYEEDKHLTFQEYKEKLKAISDQIKTEYNISLPKIETSIQCK